MSYLNKRPISGCLLPYNVKQLLLSLILLLAFCAARSQNTAGFFISQKTGCFGSLAGVTIYENSTGTDAVIQRDWDLGNGTIINNGAGIVSTDYTSKGKYYISLTATFANGEVQTVTDSVEVHDEPVITITGKDLNCLTAASKLQYSSSVITTDQIAWYKWMIDADSVGDGPNLDYVYRIPGTHMLQLEITTTNGCTYSATKSFVMDYIATYFGMTTGRYCGSGTVTFSNYSINVYPLTSSVWSYGDGSTSTNYQEAHTYTAPGNYTVKLVETSMTGCMDSTTFVDTVKVLTVPSATINGPALICLTPASTLQYNTTITTTDVIRQYKWAIDGSTVASIPNLNYDYRIPGNHDIAFTIKSSKGCDATVNKTIFIDSVRTNFGTSARLLCTDSVVTFTNPLKSYGAATYRWSFGDGGIYNGNDTSHTYAPGIYTVKLYGETVNGCKDSTSIVNGIKVSGKWSASITGNDIICISPSSRLQYNGVITGNETIAKYKWMIDADSVANTINLDIDYRKPGNHTITFIVTSVIGCNVTASKTIIIDSVKTNFSMNKTRLCGDSTVTFKNLSANAATANYVWTFSDGTSFNGLETAHTYPGSGTYSVKLLAATVNGCKDSTALTDTIKIFNKPTASISGKDVVCFTPSARLQYTGNVISADVITNYKWMIDGNTVATTVNLNYNYRQTGKHIISFEATTATGCSATATKEIIIDSVKTNFGIDTYHFCGSDTVNFTNKSKAGSAATYTWSFGDGNTGTGNNSSHNYSNTGLYSVKLNAITTNGCTDSTIFKDTIRVSVQPKVTITGESLYCKPGMYNYEAASTAVESIDSYQWYADGKPAGNTKNSAFYLTAGAHNIAVKVISLNGCSDSTSKQIFVDSVKSKFSDSQNKFCADTAAVQFTSNATAAGNIAKYEWQFGDNSSSSLQNPIHTYKQPGKYDATLIITSNNGCSDTSSVISAIEINKKPVAAINGDLIHCTAGTFTYNAATNSNQSSTIYLWRVNGNAVAATTGLNYNFNSAGIYNILLTTTDNTCTDTSEIKVTVDTVTASFSADNYKFCGESGTVRFTNTSSSASGNETYLWNFGDGQNANEKQPQHIFNAGKYLPSLKVTTANGCTATFTATDSIKIYSVKANINGDDEKCAGTTLQYNAVIISQSSITNYNWKLDNTTISNNDKVIHDFNNAGTYKLQLEVNSIEGCTATAEKIITIHPLPVPNASADTTVCKGTTVQLKSSGGNNYQWQPAGLMQNANSPTPSVVVSQSNTFYVTVTNQHGCSQNDTVVIKADEPTALTISSNKAICIGDKVQLTASANAVNYLWNNETTLSNKNVAAPFAQPNTTTTYQVIAFSGNVCKNDTANITVTVGNIPTINAGTDKTVEANSTVQLNASGNNGEALQYNWGPADGLNCINCTSPSFTAVKDITYTLTVKTIYGCTASDDIFIKVMPAKANLYMPTAFSPNNDRLNDFFYVKGYGMVTVKSMIIFNRLGQKIFEKQNVPANDPSQGWNGEINGMPVGGNESFVYMVVVIDKDGKEITQKGTITVVR